MPSCGDEEEQEFIQCQHECEQVKAFGETD